MKRIIFDLDGTLLDTSPGILESVRYAAEIMGYPELPMEKLYTFIGPPLRDSFMRCYGCDRAEAEGLTAEYRKHYREGALLNAKPYDGILELCEALRGAGYQLSVATSKPQVFAEQILHHFGFDKYMDQICGADLEGKLTKADLIRRCIGDRNPSACIMVGDTEYDAKGAQEAGISFIGVRYGFGNLDEMYPMADTPLDVLRIIHKTRC